MTTIVNVKVDQEVKMQAQRVAEGLGFTLSGVINAYLRQLVRTKTVFVSETYNEPSELLLAAIKEAKEDRKTHKHYSFKDSKEAIDFLDKIIAKKK